MKELTLKDFSIGERVWYFLSHGSYQATIINITSKRLVVRLDGYPNHRNTMPEYVRKMDD